MVQLAVQQEGLRHMPLVGDAEGTFYFKGESDSSIWLSPHDEIATDPCDAAPEEIDIAIAMDRFEQVVDWPITRVERSWAGLRSFAPDRVPVYGLLLVRGAGRVRNPDSTRRSKARVGPSSRRGARSDGGKHRTGELFARPVRVVLLS
jgi:glycine/D-amino acid oxidase-like deaminating enzyme